MEAADYLAKRHGTVIHVETANIFAVIVLSLLLLYSVIAKVNARYRLKLDPLLRIVKSPVFLVLLWSGLCIGAIFWHFKTDVKQISRRYGQLSIASATISVFLSLKPAPLPQMFHTSLVTIHKWIGRCCVLFATIHGAVFSITFIKRAHEAAKASVEHVDKRHEGHSSKPFTLFNVFGMISLAALVIILFSSLKIVRRRAYWLFYALHRPLAILFYVLMVWHARPSSPFLIALGLSFICLQLIVRAILTCRMKVTDVQTFGNDLQLVSFECRNGIFDLSRVGKAGTYIRVSPPSFSPVQFFRPSHPYTLAGNGQLIVRRSRFQLDSVHSYCAYGPFNTSLDLDQYQRVLMIMGGSGISFAPIVVKEFATPSQLKLCWVTRNKNEREILKHVGISDCDVYITNSMSGEVTKDEEQSYELDNMIEESQELTESLNDDTENENLLRSSSISKKIPGIHTYSGRPDFDRVVEPLKITRTEANSGLLVISCGPESLVNDVKRWTNRHGYSFWSEVYAL